MGRARRRHNTVFGQMAAQGIDCLGTLPHQQIPRPERHCRQPCVVRGFAPSTAALQ